METALPVFQAVLALAAAIVGILGETWSSARSDWWRRLTPTGWWCVGLTLAFCGATIWREGRDRSAENAREVEVSSQLNALQSLLSAANQRAGELQHSLDEAKSAVAKLANAGDLTVEEYQGLIKVLLANVFRARARDDEDWIQEFNALAPERREAAAKLRDASQALADVLNKRSGLLVDELIASFDRLTVGIADPPKVTKNQPYMRVFDLKYPEEWEVRVFEFAKGDLHLTVRRGLIERGEVIRPAEFDVRHRRGSHINTNLFSVRISDKESALAAGPKLTAIKTTKLDQDLMSPANLDIISAAIRASIEWMTL